MPKKRTKKDFGEGECKYRFCDRPGKRFPKKKEDQKYCCDKHRLLEWNLDNPRTKAGIFAKKQEPFPFSEPITPNPAAMVPQVKIIGTGREWYTMKFKPRPDKIEKLFEGGEILKEKGQKQAIAHSNGFVIQMRHVAIRIAKERGSVTSDDLRAEAVKLGITPHHPNVWGSIFNGEFEMTGRKKSEYKGNHAREIKVWSLVRKVPVL